MEKKFFGILAVVFFLVVNVVFAEGQVEQVSGTNVEVLAGDVDANTGGQVVDEAKTPSQERKFVIDFSKFGDNLDLVGSRKPATDPAIMAELEELRAQLEAEKKLRAEAEGREADIKAKLTGIASDLAWYKKAWPPMKAAKEKAEAEVARLSGSQSSSQTDTEITRLSRELADARSSAEAKEKTWLAKQAGWEKQKTDLEELLRNAQAEVARLSIPGGVDPQASHGDASGFLSGEKDGEGDGFFSVLSSAFASSSKFFSSTKKSNETNMLVMVGSVLLILVLVGLTVFGANRLLYKMSYGFFSLDSNKDQRIKEFIFASAVILAVCMIISKVMGG